MVLLKHLPVERHCWVHHSLAQNEHSSTSSMVIDQPTRRLPIVTCYSFAVLQRAMYSAAITEDGLRTSTESEELGRLCNMNATMQTDQDSSATGSQLNNTAIAPFSPDERCRRGSAMSNSARSNNTGSTLSDISNQTGGMDGPMDIFHPKFWESAAAPQSVPIRVKSPTRVKSKVLVEPVSPTSMYDSFAAESTYFCRIESSKEEDLVKAHELNDSYHHRGASYKSSSGTAVSSTEPSRSSIASSLEHLIQTLNQLPHDGIDSDDESFQSDISEISGLTEVISEFAAINARLGRSMSDDLALDNTGHTPPAPRLQRTSSMDIDAAGNSPPRQPRRRGSTGTSPVETIQITTRSPSVDTPRRLRSASTNTPPRTPTKELFVASKSDSPPDSTVGERPRSASTNTPPRSPTKTLFADGKSISPIDRRPRSASTNTPPRTPIKSLFVEPLPSSAKSPAAKKAQAVLAISKNRRTRRRAVSFDSVHIRQYERILSDNPASRKGPSIGIGWRYTDQTTVKLSQFEGIRKKQRCRRASELVLSRKERETLIYQLGYTERDVAAMIREINKVRYKRQQTVNNLNAPIQKMEEAVETARRKMMGVLTLQSIGAHAASPHVVKACPQQPRLPQRGWVEI